MRLILLFLFSFIFIHANQEEVVDWHSENSRLYRTYFKLDMELTNSENKDLKIKDWGYKLGRLFDYTDKKKSDKYQSLALLAMYRISNENTLTEIDENYVVESMEKSKFKMVLICTNSKKKSPPNNLNEDDLVISEYSIKRKLMQEFLYKNWEKNGDKYNKKYFDTGTLKVAKFSNKRYNTRAPYKENWNLDIKKGPSLFE